MLQQTQVDRVIPHYERFLAAFPTPAACAAAGPAAVVRLWSGLGYNRRRAEPASGGGGHGGRPRRHGAARGRRTPRAARRRAVHGAGGAHLRLRGRRGRGRHQRRARPGPRRGGHPAHAARGDGTGGPARAGRRVVGVQPGDVRPGRHRVHGGAPRLRPVPAAPPVRLAPSGRGCARAPTRGGSSPTARPQSTFAGSDRQGRGRLLDALRHGGVRRSGLAGACGWPEDPARAERVAAAVVAEGFAAWSGGKDPVLRLR